MADVSIFLLDSLLLVSSRFGDIYLVSNFFVQCQNFLAVARGIGFCRFSMQIAKVLISRFMLNNLRLLLGLSAMQVTNQCYEENHNGKLQPWSRSQTTYDNYD